MGASRYLLLESGPHRVLAEDLRTEVDATQKAIWKFVKRHRLKGFYMTGEAFGNKLVGFHSTAPIYPVPPEWRLLGSGNKACMVPRKKSESLRAEIAALPKHRNMRVTISQAICWAADGRDLIPLCQLGWAGDSFIITVPAYGFGGEPSLQAAEKAAAFAIPDGCREITEAEWELIVAQHKVATDRKAA